MPGALEGIRVVELTTVILGPWATQTLGDMGADVIKVETPAGDTTRNLGPKRNPGMASLYMASNRNKRSVVLDLTQESGREALHKLVQSADVFVHNMRPKVAAKLGLAYEKFAKDNPGLIYCATFGFGASKEFIKVGERVEDDEEPVQAQVTDQERLHELAEHVAVDDLHPPT